MDDLMQSTPFMPPIAKDMATGHVFVFGDQTVPFEQDLRRLLHVKDNDILRSLFDRVGFALRNELASLPANQQDWFPRFTTVIDLVSKLDEAAASPVLKFTLLCLCEIGQFIGYFGAGSRPYPDIANTYLVGLCTGSFAAAAISTSQTLSELIPAGVEAVLVAFRTALRSFVLRHDLEQPISGIPKSWSVVVNISHSEAVSLIQNFCDAKGIAHSNKLYVSSMMPTNTTISGPPSTLTDFLAENAMKSHYLPIELPYHAPHLFGPDDVDQIVRDFHDPTLNTYAPRFRVLSAASGNCKAIEDYKTLLQRTVSDTLSAPLRWDKILQYLVDEISSQKFEECMIYPLSSTSGQIISSALTQASKIRPIINTLIGSAGPSPSGSTGKFEQSKIAIIGYSGRFPDAASNEDFWELLHAGLDVHRTIPEDRFDWKAHFDPTGKTKNTSKVQYGCFIKEPGLFDTRFFNMSPRESENTDPAQRLAITTAYEAIEMAGLVPNRTPSTQQDRIGVFFGITSDDWREVNSGQNVDTYFIPGGNRAFVPGRISYFFRFCGPSLSIDTACSSSFAAIQTACAYLWRGECDTAVAGGTNVLTNPDNFAGLDRGHFLSTTGNCNAFDDGASGYCRADAVGSVILKRLEDAEADKDPIFGVIVGAYTNHCGQTDSITRPHEGDQSSVFKRIMRHTGVDPLDISYVEMHGTGTQAGDATEMNSVLSVFVPGRQRMPHYPLFLGSAKANVGHAESASGVSSLIKVLMMMKNSEIPPHCGIKTKINHNYPLDLEERNVNIAFTPVPWVRENCHNGKRICFLNNFSAAGGNTAVLLEDPPLPKPIDNFKDPRTVHIITVTAKTSKSLNGNISSMIAFLQRHPEIHLPALSYTTTARRLQHNYRVLCSGSDVKCLLESLEAKLRKSDVKPIPNALKTPKVTFVFTGQGTFYNGIGQQLFECISQFRADILRFNSIAQQQGFPGFVSVIDGTCEDCESVEPVISHVALTCLQIALCRLWISWGIKPSATTGHSLGEYAALYAAGVLTASQAIFLVGTRAKLLSTSCSKGTHAMLAIKSPLDVIKPLLVGSQCELACLNQPTSHVISGPGDEIAKLAARCQSSGQECVQLDIRFAFHSAQVDPILEHFETAANTVRYDIPSIPYISPLLGRIVSDGATLGASYLTRACRNTVNFQGALEAAREASIINDRDICLEIGSHPACSGMVKGTLGSQITTVPTLRKGTDTWKVIASGLESLYANGIDVEWNEYHRDFKSSQRVIDLPRYSWDLKNYWIQYRNNFCLTKGEDPKPDGPMAVDEKPAAVYLSPSVQRVLEEHHSAGISTLLVESDIHDPRLAPVIQGHKVNGAALCPSSLYADIAMQMADYMLKGNNISSETTGLDVANVKVDKPLIAMTDRDSQLLRISASADWTTNLVSFSLYSVNADGKKAAEHASCEVKITQNQRWLEDWRRVSYLIESRIKSLNKAVDEEDAHKMKRGIVYKLFSSLVDYDASYQGMQEVILDSKELEATAKVSFQVDQNGFFINPCWIDSLGHIAGFIMNGNDNVHSKTQVFVNHGWDRMRCSTTFSRNKVYRTYNKMQLVGGTMYAGDTYILDGDTIVAVFEGVKFQGIPRQMLDHLLPGKKTSQKIVGQAGKISAPATISMATRPNTSAAESSKPSSSVRKISRPTIGASLKEPAASTRLDIVSRVLSVIGEEAGIKPADLSPNDEFGDYGIDSLLSLTICGRLQEELGLELPSSLFADYPTIKELSNFFQESETTLSSTNSSMDDKDLRTPDQDSELDPTSSDETRATSVDESNDVIGLVRATIAEETGVAMADIAMSTNFAELGVDSLLGLTIVGRLSETLEIEVPSTLFTENDTLDGVEAALGLKSKYHSRKAPSMEKADITSLAIDEPPRSTSILLQGNPKSAAKILWLFPDGSGSATSYATLARISADVVVYGLNCPWMKIPQDMKCGLEGLTAKYLREIRRRQPHGPYYFGGWSAGGICAFEAAQQLSREGEETARLILIDSPNPIGLENPPQRMYDFFESLDFFGMNGKAPPSWLRPHFNAFIGLLDDYKIQPFISRPLKTHIIYARDGICKNPGDPRPEIRLDDPREMVWLLNNRTDFSASGWTQLVGSANITIGVLDDVNHFSMVAPGPKMTELSAFIAKALE